MNLMIAQGGGFYGSAIATTDLSKEQIRTACLSRSGMATDQVVVHSLHGRGGVEIGLNIEISSTQTSVQFLENWSGNPQPTPVLLFDSGNADNDLAALALILGLAQSTGDWGFADHPQEGGFLGGMVRDTEEKVIWTSPRFGYEDMLDPVS